MITKIASDHKFTLAQSTCVPPATAWYEYRSIPPGSQLASRNAQSGYS